MDPTVCSAIKDGPFGPHGTKQKMDATVCIATAPVTLETPRTVDESERLQSLYKHSTTGGSHLHFKIRKAVQVGKRVVIFIGLPRSRPLFGGARDQPPYKNRTCAYTRHLERVLDQFPVDAPV